VGHTSHLSGGRFVKAVVLVARNIFDHLLDFVFQAEMAIWITHFVRAKPADSAIIASRQLIFPVQIAIPDQLFVTGAGRRWHTRPDGAAVNLVLVPLLNC